MSLGCNLYGSNVRESSRYIFGVESGDRATLALAAYIMRDISVIDLGLRFRHSSGFLPFCRDHRLVDVTCLISQRYKQFPGSDSFKKSDFQPNCLAISFAFFDGDLKTLCNINREV
jgi:hypothetical protein